SPWAGYFYLNNPISIFSIIISSYVPISPYLLPVSIPYYSCLCPCLRLIAYAHSSLPISTPMSMPIARCSCPCPRLIANAHAPCPCPCPRPCLIARAHASLPTPTHARGFLPMPALLAHGLRLTLNRPTTGMCMGKGDGAWA